jgi:hypothetical protein
MVRRGHRCGTMSNVYSLASNGMLDSCKDDVAICNHRGLKRVVMLIISIAYNHRRLHTDVSRQGEGTAIPEPIHCQSISIRSERVVHSLRPLSCARLCCLAFSAATRTT